MEPEKDIFEQWNEYIKTKIWKIITQQHGNHSLDPN